MIVTLLLLLIFSNSSVFLFIGTCCLGLFISSVFPCMLALTEDILEYKGIATDGPPLSPALLKLFFVNGFHGFDSSHWWFCSSVFTQGLPLRPRQQEPPCFILYAVGLWLYGKVRPDRSYVLRRRRSFLNPVVKASGRNYFKING